MLDDETNQLQRLLTIPSRAAAFIGVGVIVGILVIGVLALLHPRASSAKPDFPAATIRQISGFKFYYFKPGFSTDFKLDQNSIHYQSGVLIFSMKNPAGKTLAFTEQASPPHFEADMLQTDKQFNTEYGQAFVTDQADRTSGALITQDNTWIIINAPSPIGADTMQQLLNALGPVTL